MQRLTMSVNNKKILMLCINSITIANGKNNILFTQMKHHSRDEQFQFVYQGYNDFNLAKRLTVRVEQINLNAITCNGWNEKQTKSICFYIRNRERLIYTPTHPRTHTKDLDVNYYHQMTYEFCVCF